LTEDTTSEIAAGGTLSPQSREEAININSEDTIHIFGKSIKPACPLPLLTVKRTLFTSYYLVG